MINIKLYKNEIELIRESIQSSKWFGNEPKLCDRLLKKIDKALTIPVVVGTFFCQHKLVLDCKEQCHKCKQEPNS